MDRFLVRTARFCCLIVLVFGIRSLFAQYEISDTDGKTISVSGSFEKMDEESLFFSDEKESMVFSLENLAEIQPAKPPESERWTGNVHLVELLDGSKLVVSKLDYDGKNFTFIDLFGKKSTVSHSAVASVRLELKGPEEVDSPGAEWVRIVQTKKATSDRIVVRTFDYIEGIIEGIDEETVKFNLDGEVIPAKYARVYGVIFHHPGNEETKNAGVLCHLKDNTGSGIAVAELSFEEGKINWKTPAGLSGETPSEKLVSIDFARKGIVPLVDLTPDSFVREAPVGWIDRDNAKERLDEMLRKFSLARIEKTTAEATSDNSESDRILNRAIARSEPPQRELTPIQGVAFDGKRYSIGLVLQAKSSLTYRLNEPYKSLRGLVGIDDRFRPNGRVRFSILGNDRVIFEEIISGDMKAKSLNLNIEGIETLKMTVDFVEGFTPGCQLEFAEMRLLK